MIDLVAEFKKRARQIDRETVTPDMEATQMIPLIEPTVGLYNIHKRSLPVGTDKIVGIGFTKAQAEQALGDLFKAKKKGETVFYYDIIPQSATGAEKQVLYNPRPVSQEDK
jgi:hypothetical protein